MQKERRHCRAAINYALHNTQAQPRQSWNITSVFYSFRLEENNPPGASSTSQGKDAAHQHLDSLARRVLWLADPTLRDPLSHLG